MRSSNPALSGNVFQSIDFHADSTRMTITGTALKTLIALMLAFMTAGFTYLKYRDGVDGVDGLVNVTPYLIGGVIVGLIAFIATMFKQHWAPITTPIYALAEGFFLGGISAMIQSRMPQQPIVFQACGLTLGVLFIMLVLYQSGIIKVTDKLRMGIVACTGAIALLYLVSFALSFFGMPIAFIHSAGPMDIAFSVFVVGLAAFNLLLDFDLIDRMAAQGAPKYMEWYGAFALMVTLVWLYMEILRLLSKLNRRD